MARSRDRIGDFHRDFADRLIEQIKAGTAPFQKSWKPGERSVPENLRTGEPYRGGNSLRLSAAAQDKGYTDNRWGTYRQIAAAGGHVRKGEKGTKVLVFPRHRVVPAKDDQGQPRLTDDGEPIYTRVGTQRSFPRAYTVFNAEQTAGLPPRRPASPEPEWKAHEQAEAIIEASGVDVRHQAGDRAYYNVRTDQVVLPDPGQFPSAGNYYQTALHELGHATGHPDRLNRDTLGKPHGSPDYAREELRAEIAAMMTGDRIGLGHKPQNGTAYVAGWVKALEDDPREIQRAAADAEKISTYLIEPTREQTTQREQPTTREPASITLTPREATRLIDSYAEQEPLRDAAERLADAELPVAARTPTDVNGPGVAVAERDDLTVWVAQDDVDAVIYGRDRQPGQELTPAPAPQAEPARQPAQDDFNLNIQLAADAALDRLTHNGHEGRPPDTLGRQLQNVRLAAAQNVYTQQSADFRGLRSDLHDHAIRADGLSPDDRKAVLRLADNFNNQAQGHDLRDFHRLDLERAVADAASRDDGPTRG